MKRYKSLRREIEATAGRVNGRHAEIDWVPVRYLNRVFPRKQLAGFYRVARKQLNPNSRHHLAFNIGFPNALDQELGRTGSFLMVHGGCTSVGCYAMTDAQIDEIYAVIEAAFDRGQDEVDVSIFPFRMTETAIEATAQSEWSGFWRNLKQGFDLFERDGTPPKVAACNGTYVFGGDALAPGCRPITGWV